MQKGRSGKSGKSEKGAAMVMVLLISTLLLAAVGGLLLEVSINTANVTDATAEQQAYNAAESGIQSAINVLRGNTPPTVFFDASKPANDPVNAINFRKAVTRGASNLSGDASSAARLSRWMNYNYPSGNAAAADRITLNPAAQYDPRSGYAFAVEVMDPDDTGQIVSLQILNSAAANQTFYDETGTPAWKQSITVGSGTGTAIVTYTPPFINPINNLDVADGSEDTAIGSFSVSPAVGIVTIAEDIRFKITVKMIAPYNATKELRGWIKAGSYSSSSGMRFEFDSPVYQLMGSSMTLAGGNVKTVSLNGLPSPIGVNVTQAEPYRVVVRATGYGPRGAKKVLEATVQKNFFNGLSAPATLTLVGPPGSGFQFNAGSSQNVTYSGDDMYSNVVIPSIGTTSDQNLEAIRAMLAGRSRKADISGPPANVSAEVPFWLESPTNLNATVESLKMVAKSSGRYFAGGNAPSDWGNNATAMGITFVDGDASFSGSGGGILIVTGRLTLRGGVDFNGLIIVTGEDGLDRSGGGNGLLRGNTVIAPYDKNNLNAGFKSPKYDISGGGTSEIRYDSSSIANGMTAVSNFVLAVAEK